MDETDHPEPSLFALHRIPNGVLVLLTVALLLQGPAGTVDAFWNYTKNLVGTLFGGEDLFWEVLCQTAPLTLASAAIAFAIRCRWISPRDLTCWLAISVVVLTATWFGGELRSFNAKSHRQATLGLDVTASSKRSQVPVTLASVELPSDRTVEPRDNISLAEAIRIVADMGGAATEVRHHHWSDDIPRVIALPGEGETVFGMMARGINQLLGYFVVYGPRLFLASVLLGCYLGWSWQPYFQAITCWLDRRRPVPNPTES